MSNSKDSQELINQARQKRQRLLLERFEQSPSLDSAVFFEIPRLDLDTDSYKVWLVEDVETPWIRDFNGNQDYRPNLSSWNENEGGILGKFGENYLQCKLHRYDGTREAYAPGDYREKRGLFLRDHFSELDAGKVLLISDNLQQYLISLGTEFTRFNFDRKGRGMIKAD